MARIRTIKPGFFTHPDIVTCSPLARLLLLSMFTQADDEGRLYDEPTKILANAFDVDGQDKGRAGPRLIDELERRGRLLRYEKRGRRCVYVVGFRKHQRIDRPSESVIPPPPADLVESLESDEPSTLFPRTLGDDSTTTRRALAAGSGSGSGTGNREQGSSSTDSQRPSKKAGSNSFDALSKSVAGRKRGLS